MRPTLHTADVLSYAAGYTGEPYHALLCDPPYELAFMSRSWDRTGIAFRPATWAAFLPLLHPGAFGMAFAGSRGLHRMMVAIEDAGYLIHPVIGWCYGSGFPKATRIDTQIDAANGRQFEDRYALGRYIKAQRELLGLSREQVNTWFGAATKCEHFESDSPGFARVPTPDDFTVLKERLDLDDRFDGLIDRIGAERETIGERTHINGGGAAYELRQGERVEVIEDITAPATDLARDWAGHRYGLQALKPALEFIVVFQKPYAGRPVDSMVATGAGALNIAASRIGNGGNLVRPAISRTDNAVYSTGLGIGTQDEPAGRWPSNLVLSHSYDCAPPDCAPGCAVAALGAQSGESVSRPDYRNEPSNTGASGIYGDGYKRQPNGVNDTGTAARYFFQADYAAERLEAAEPIFYQSKASTAEREAGLSGRQMARMEDISGGGGINHAKADAYQARKSDRLNVHPTLKPIALARHLATLLLPPARYAPRRLFVPFAGVASECIGAMQAGWEIVDGVELEAEHVEIGRARIAWWAEQGVQLTLFEEDQ